MNVSIGERWQDFVETIVKSGRYASASEVVREGLRLVEEREAKLLALRTTLSASIEEGGSFTDEDVSAALDAEVEALALFPAREPVEEQENWRGRSPSYPRSDPATGR